MILVMFLGVAFKKKKLKLKRMTMQCPEQCAIGHVALILFCLWMYFHLYYKSTQVSAISGIVAGVIFLISTYFIVLEDA